MVIDWRPRRYRGGSGWIQSGLAVAIVGVVSVVVPPTPVEPTEIIIAAESREVEVAAESREIVIAAEDRVIVVPAKV